jgi:uncharacterized protein DUF4209
MSGSRTLVLVAQCAALEVAPSVKLSCGLHLRQEHQTSAGDPPPFSRIRGVTQTQELSPENIPIRIVSTEEEQRHAAIVEYDMRAIVLWAIWASDVLNDVAIRQRPTVADLTQHFTTEIIPAEVAERVAAAVDHFWEGRYDEALFVLLPRFEAIIRELCRQLGLVITKEPIGTEAGGFLQLGALLFALTGRLPESRRCYLTTLLTDPIGFNLRNRGLHGLIASGTREDAALAIHAACFLQQIRLEARSQT